MITLNSKDLKFIDLSLPIHEMRNTSPEEITRCVLEEECVWPIETYDSYVDDTVCQYVKLKTHVKTHAESPWHLNKKGNRISDFPLDYFVGRAVNLSFDLPWHTLITREVIEACDNGRIQLGDRVICHNKLGEDFPNAPVLTPEAADYLLEKGINLFGNDNSVNIGETFHGKRFHDMILANGKVLLEMMTNLDQLSQNVFFLCAIPGMIKIQGLDSSTTPVLAIEGFNII